MDFNNNSAPIYLQIADYICEKILWKEWQAEDKIPSVRELAIQLAVNPNTVARTYEFLKQQEIIYDKRGIGYFIAPNGYQLAMLFRKQEFTDKELPQLFRTLYMLGMQPEDLTNAFAKFIKNYKPQNN